MNYDELSPELKQKVSACKTQEDVLALAREQGYELSDVELEAVAGGDWDCWEVCSGYCDADYHPCPGDIR